MLAETVSLAGEVGEEVLSQLVVPRKPRNILDYFTMDVFDRLVKDMNGDTESSFEDWLDDASEILKTDWNSPIEAQMQQERIPRSEKRREVEAAKYVRETLSKRLEFVEGVEPGSVSRCDFCLEPCYTRKQEVRMKMLYPILTGDRFFSIDRMRDAFWKFSKIMFGLGWFRNSKMSLTFGILLETIIRGRLLIPRIKEDYSYLLDNKSEGNVTFSYWIRDLKLFAKVFGGPRYSTSLLYNAAECYNSTLRNRAPKVYAQMFGIKEAITSSVSSAVSEMTPGIMSTFGEELKNYISSFILDWPKHVGDVVENIVSGVNCNFVTKIYDFLCDVYRKVRSWIEKWWTMFGYDNSMLVDILCVLVLCALAHMLWTTFEIGVEFMKLGMAIFFKKAFGVRLRPSVHEAIAALYVKEVVEAQFLGCTTSLIALAGVVVSVLDYKAVSSVSSVLNIVSRAVPMSDTVINDFKGVVDAIYFYITNDHLFPDVKTVELFNERMKKMEEFVSTPDLKEKVMREPVFTKELASLVEESWNYKEVLKCSGSPLLGHYSRMYQQLFELNAEALASADMYKARIETVMLWLSGKPKMGKSLLMDLVSQAVYLELQHLYGDKEYPEWSPGQVYERTKGSDYWEGYWGQWACKKNEVLALSVADEKAKEVLEILNICEESVFPLNMAFKEKGKAFFRSELFVATTNYILDDSNLGKLGVENPNALIRRRTFPITVIRQDDLKPNYSNLDSAWSLRVVYPSKNMVSSFFDGLSVYLHLHPEDVKHDKFVKQGFYDFTFSQIVEAMTLEIKLRKDKPKTLIEFGKHYKPGNFPRKTLVLKPVVRKMQGFDPLKIAFEPAIVFGPELKPENILGPIYDDTISLTSEAQMLGFAKWFDFSEDDGEVIVDERDPDIILNDRQNTEPRFARLLELRQRHEALTTVDYDLFYRVERFLLGCDFSDYKAISSDIRRSIHWHDARRKNEDFVAGQPPLLRTPSLKKWVELMNEDGGKICTAVMNIEHFTSDLLTLKFLREDSEGFAFSKLTTFIVIYLSWYRRHSFCRLDPRFDSDNFTNFLQMEGKVYNVIVKHMFSPPSFKKRYKVKERWDTIVDNFWTTYNSMYDWVCSRPVFDYVLFGSVIVGSLAVMLVPHIWSTSETSVTSSMEYIESQMLSKELQAQSITKGRLERVQNKTVSANSITKGKMEKAADRRVIANSAAQHIQSRFDKAARNLVAMRFNYAHSPSIDTYVFFVHGTTCVVTSHYFRALGTDFLSASILSRIGGDPTVSFDRSCVHLKFLDDKNHPRGSRDFCIITINPTTCPVQAVKDVRKNLPSGDRTCPREGVVRLKLNVTKNSTTQLVVTGKDFVTYSLHNRRDIENVYERGTNKFVPVTNYIIGHNMRGDNGDCMLPYISTYNLDSVVYFEGFHVGSSGYDAFFCPLFQEDFEEKFDFLTGEYIPTSNAQMPLSSYFPKELKMVYESSGADHLSGAKYIGTLERSFFMPSDTVFIPTLFQGDIHSDPIFPVNNAPALLKPTYVEGVLKEPFKKGKVKLTAVDKSTPTPSWAIKQGQIDHRVFTDGFAPPREIPRPKFEEQTIEEACFGIPGKQASLDLTTSEGFSLKTKGLKRKDVVNFETQWISPKLKMMVARLRLAVKKGKIPRLMAIACQKDELRDLPRVLEGKTRLFCIGDFVHMVWTRIVLGNLIIWLKEHRAQTSGAIGTNVHGFDWATLMSKIDGSNVEFGGGDYGGYDTGLRYWFGYLLGLFCCDEMGLDWKTNGREVMYCCLSSTCPMLVVGRYVYNFDFMNPSGGFLTGFLNTFVNICLFHIFFYKLRSECAANCQCGFHTSVYNDVIRAIFYGDDNIFSVLRKYGHHFNMITVSRLCEEMFGMTYTTASKEVVENPFIEREDIEFLMRKFVDGDGILKAPLDKDSIYSMILWIRDRKSDVENFEQLQQNIDTFQMEMFYHGRDEFDSHANKIREYARTRNVNFELRPYEHFLARHTAAYC